jgi:hypothetical protein
MATIQTVRCPNCGCLAERHYLHVLAQVQTQCDACDYFMLVSTLSGKVLEAHAPGTSPESIHKHIKQGCSLPQRHKVIAKIEPQITKLLNVA